MTLFRENLTKLAIVQMNVVLDDVQANIRTASRFMDDCASQGSALLVLPQAFATGINPFTLKEAAEPIPGGPIISFLTNRASQLNVHIVAGILERDGANVYDAAVLISPDGELLGKYRRWFLWNLERDFISPGKPAAPFATSIARIGLLIGYDLFFPEACRPLFRGQVDLIICVASLGDRYALSVEQVCATRALENHCYFAFASALGYHPLLNSKFLGKSAITCDPLFLVYERKQSPTPEAHIVGSLGRQPAILACDLALATLSKCKHKTPQRADLEFALGCQTEGHRNDRLDQ